MSEWWAACPCSQPAEYKCLLFCLPTAEQSDSFSSARFQQPMASSNACTSCGTSGATCRCSRCRSAWFCSTTCQRTAWPTHKKDCNPKQADEAKPSVTDKAPVAGSEQATLDATAADAAAAATTAPANTAAADTDNTAPADAAPTAAPADIAPTDTAPADTAPTDTAPTALEEPSSAASREVGALEAVRCLRKTNKTLSHENAAHAALDLARETADPAAATRFGAVSDLLNTVILHGTYEKAALYAAGALQRLTSEHPPARGLFVAAGGVCKVMPMLDLHEDPRVVKAVCGLIYNVCLEGVEQRLNIARAGGIKALASTAHKRMGDGGAAAAAIAALASSIAQVDENKAAAREAGWRLNRSGRVLVLLRYTVWVRIAQKLPVVPASWLNSSQRVGSVA